MCSLRYLQCELGQSHGRVPLPKAPCTAVLAFLHACCNEKKKNGIRILCLVNSLAKPFISRAPPQVLMLSCIILTVLVYYNSSVKSTTPVHGSGGGSAGSGDGSGGGNGGRATIEEYRGGGGGAGLFGRNGTAMSERCVRLLFVIVPPSLVVVVVVVVDSPIPETQRYTMILVSFLTLSTQRSCSTITVEFFMLILSIRSGVRVLPLLPPRSRGNIQPARCWFGCAGPCC